MKKIAKRSIALLVALILALSCFVGCSSQGKTLMELDDNKISVNLFMLYLSRMKGMLCSSYSFGSAAIKDSFWDTVMSADGTTYNSYYTSSVLDNAKTYLSALYEFDQRGLELPKSTLESIDEKINGFIENDANGSKTEFNSILSGYGVNYKLLREAYIIEAKISYLKDTIYGADGSLIAKNLVDDYYEQNYARFKQVFLHTYDYVYETDSNDDPIYYKADGKISYDTTATKKVDSNGAGVLDANGDQIYVRVDENGITRVAYDKQNGARVNKTDEDGNYIIEKYTDDKLSQVKEQAKTIYEALQTNDFEAFDALVSDGEEYPNGIYVTRSSTYDSQKVIDAVFEMEVGESCTVTSDYGIHIIMRYELEEDGYKKDANSDFFISTSTGNYVFMNDMKNQLLSQYLAQHKDKIVVDTAVLEGVDMKSVGANFYY